MLSTNAKQIEQFLEMLAAERQAAKNTLESYHRDLIHFCHFLKDCPLIDVQSDIIHQYINNLSDHFSSATQARRISALKQFYNFLMQEEVIFKNPCLYLKTSRQKRVLSKVLREEQVKQLLDSLYVNAAQENPSVLRMRALLETLYASGLRVSELVELPLKSLIANPQSKELQSMLLIKGKGGRERLVPLNAAAISALKAYLSVREWFVSKKSVKMTPWLFPSESRQGHLTRQGFGQLLKQQAVLANLDPKILSPHIIRHSFATHLLNRGADLLVIQKLLGHADISTTQIYTHIVPEHLLELVTKHHPLQKF